jgi:hypothetical protein
MSGNTNNTVFIQRLFSSRDNFVEGNVQEATSNTANFVGQEGRIWWDPTRNNFYASDGSTPGGIPIGGGGGGAPGGNTYDVQLNGGSNTFIGTGNLTFVDNVLNVNGNVSANYFIGDGSQLTNIVVDIPVLSVTANANTIVADSATPTVITDMTLTPGAGTYLVTYNSEYTSTLTGSVTATAAADLATLYAALMALTPTVTDHAPTYGGETLGPGVYTQAGASSIAGTLTLDAAGDPDALFVFRSVGAFSTGVASEVVLLNGATSNNVWFVSEGAGSTGANSILRGTILANQAAASSGANATINGRLLAITGNISLGDTTIITEPTGTSVTPLGTIDIFSVFAGVGALSNTGASEIALSIGTNEGTITGFEAATIGGETYEAGAPELAVISYGIYADGVLVPDSLRTQTQTALVSGWPMAIQTLATVADGESIDVRTTVPVGAFAIGPEMSLFLMAVTNTGSSGNVAPSGPTGAIQFNAGAGLFGGSANLVLTDNDMEINGNINPIEDNTYTLGTSEKRWANVWVGPGSVHISNTESNTSVALTVDGNALVVAGTTQMLVGDLFFVENTIESSTPNIDIQIGLTTSNANIVLNRNTVVAAGKTFGLVDTVTGNIAELSVQDGVLEIDGANQLQVGQLKFVDNTIESTTGNIDIEIGDTADTANLLLNRDTIMATGKTFTAGTINTPLVQCPISNNSLELNCANLGFVKLSTQLTGPIEIVHGNNAWSFSGTTLSLPVSPPSPNRPDSEIYAESMLISTGDGNLTLRSAGNIILDLGGPSAAAVLSSTGLAVTGNLTSVNANLGNSASANYFIGNFYGTANSATVATSANSVALANVNGAGNIASLNLDGSASNVLYGNGTFAPVAGGNTTSAYGQFWSNATQTIASANTEYQFTFNNAIENSNVVLGSGPSNSRIIINQTGIYNIQFSVQSDRSGGGGSSTAYIWFKKNGENINDSAGFITLDNTINSVESWNILANVTSAGDYYEIAYASNSTNLSFPTLAGNASVGYPASPSIIVTVTPVN